MAASGRGGELIAGANREMLRSVLDQDLLYAAA
jgi:hypothetical protein